MSYTFQPMTDEQIQSEGFRLLENGDYTFEVEKSTRKISKNNNPMAELVIKIWDKDGRTLSLFDYLVFSNVGLNIKKIKNFCHAVGLENEYKKGELPEDLNGFSGKVTIGIRDETPKEGGGFYPKKNIVKDYVCANVKTNNHATTEKKYAEDELPF